MRLSKPLIAAVSGYAVAGGLELALLADLRVVEESSIMGIFCRRFGRCCFDVLNFDVNLFKVEAGVALDSIALFVHTLDLGWKKEFVFMFLLKNYLE